MTDQGLPPAVLSRLIWDHLRSLCPTCRKNLDDWLNRPRPRPKTGIAGFQVPEGTPLDDPRLDDEASARRELEELLETPVSQRMELVAQSAGRFRSGVLVDLLIQRTEDWLHDDPRRAVEFAHLAGAVAERMDALANLNQRVRALAHVGNALRASGDVLAADRKFRQIRDLLRDGAEVDVRVFAEVDLLEANVRQDQRQPAEAERLNLRALLIFRTFRWPVMVARALLSLAFLQNQLGHPDRSLESIREALDLLDPDDHLDLVCFARQNLASLLCDTGDPRAALEVLRESEPLFARYLASRPALEPRLKLRWLEGRIHRGLGDHAAAEEALREAAEGFVELEIGYDAALAYLDLAEVYLAQDKVEEVAHLAAAVEPILKANDLAEEAVAALALFRNAATRKRLSTSILQQVRGSLRRPEGGGR